MRSVAHLHELTLVLWRWPDGRLAGDLRLRLTMPTGEETRTLGPGLFGPVDEYAGKGLACFDLQARSWFDDHLSDLAEGGLTADRGFDELTLGYDVPEDVWRIIEA